MYSRQLPSHPFSSIIQDGQVGRNDKTYSGIFCEIDRFYPQSRKSKELQKSIYTVDYPRKYDSPYLQIHEFPLPPYPLFECSGVGGVGVS